MAVLIDGMLPVAMVIDGVSMSKVQMTAMTVEESLLAASKLKDGQFVVIGELTSMTVLVGEDGLSVPISYELLAGSSRQNYDYLIGLKDDLAAKERQPVTMENTPV
jgi:hypothetical protein